MKFREFVPYDDGEVEPCEKCDGTMQWGREVVKEEIGPGKERIKEELSPGFVCEDCGHIVPS